MMTVVYGSVRLAQEARDLARSVLAGQPQRWQHTVGVARRAETVAGTLATAEDADLLVAAAWLHDLGYAPALRATGFHPLDGAWYLAAHGWPVPVASLVAHHSDAADIATVRGLSSPLAEFPIMRGPVDDALTYADQTVGPDGRATTFARRILEMLKRHGPDSPNAAAHPYREPVLRAAVARVEARLADRWQVTRPSGPGHASAG